VCDRVIYATCGRRKRNPLVDLAIKKAAVKNEGGIVWVGINPLLIEVELNYVKDEQQRDK
jgi:hypothetical protein